MESWMRVGAKCVCVDGQKGVGGYPDELTPVEGEVYTIREIALMPYYHPEVPNRVWVLLEEIRQAPRAYCTGIFEPRFGACRFRPLVRQTDISSLRALLDQPADPALVREALDDATADVLRRIGMRI